MGKCEKAQIGIKLMEIYGRFRKYQNKRYFERFQLQKCQNLTLSRNLSSKMVNFGPKNDPRFFTKY